MSRSLPFGRTIALACAALLTGALAACGSSEPASTVTPTTSASTSATEATEAAEQTTGTAVPPSSATAGTQSAGTESAGTESAATSATGDSRVVKTAYGEVTVPAVATRVAALSYDTPWQLMSLGVTPVAVQDYGKWISEFTPAQQAFVEGVATIGSYGELNFEAVAAADPDLIVGDADEIDEATFKRLSQIAPTAIVKGDSRGDWKSITTALAEATGTSAAAETAQATYTATLDRLKSQYADVIAGNTWVHFSIGDDASQFSVQQPTGATGNLVVNELGLKYGPGVPTDYSESGYGSYPLEQLGTVFEGVTVALHLLNADGSTSESVQAILDNPLFTRLKVATTGKVFGLTTSVTDFVTANEWLEELEKKVLATL